MNDYDYDDGDYDYDDGDEGCPERGGPVLRPQYNRFSRLTETEVATMQRRAEQAQRARDYIEECVSKMLHELFEDGATGDTPLFRAVHEHDQLPPLPGFAAPVKRWAGGPQSLDLWYWDQP